MNDKLFSYIIDFLKVYSTKLLVLVIGFINSVVIARTLGVSGQGQYAIALTIYSIGFQVINMGLHSAHSYYLAIDKDNLSKVFGNSIGITFISLVLSFMIIIFFLFTNADVGVSYGVLFSAILIIPVYLFYYLHYQTMLVVGKIALLNVMDIFVASFHLLGNTILYLLGYISVTSVLCVILLGYIIVDIVEIAYFFNMGVYPHISLSFYFRCIRLGVVAALACFIGFLILRVDILMVQKLSGIENTGYYSLAENLVEIVNSFGATCTLVMFPKAAALEDRQEKFIFTRKVLKIASLCMIGIVLIGELLGGFLILKVYGMDYELAVAPFRILLIGIILWGIAGIPISYYATEKKYGLSIISYIIAFLCNVLLNYYWIPLYGICGAAWASTVSYFLVAVITLTYYFKNNKEKSL